MKIVQIVSRLPPAIDGVGDYACILAKQLRAAHDIHTVFVVCDPEWRNAESEAPTNTLDGFLIHQLKEQSAQELVRVLSQPAMPATALLEFVGYGYQKRGCPVWLLRGLSSWLGQQTEDRNKNIPDAQSSVGARHLVTMFHELFAYGPPWSSSFWTSPVQQWIAKSLAKISGHCFTNLIVNARTLQRRTGRAENNFTVLPVFSNVGEPEHLPPWQERRQKMVVFGSAGWRRQAYGERKPDLEKACQAMGLDEIVDIGAPVPIPQLSVRVSQRGILSAAETSREMLSARAGFFTYPINCLGKSGIFAAYAAHGLAPVTYDGNPMENGDGLIWGEHFVSAANVPQAEAGGFETIGKRARGWYLTHSIASQATSFKRHLLREA